MITPPEPEWWRDFFDATYVKAWTDAGAFDRTDQEVDGIVDLLNVAPGSRILDVPCGFGRIAGPLHERGFEVVGQDISESQLAMARDHHPGPLYVSGDMREPPAGPFDVVLNFFTSFGYFADPNDDRATLRAWHGVLRQGGVLLMTLHTHRDRIVWQRAQQAENRPSDEKMSAGEREEGPTQNVDWTMDVDWVAGTATTEVRVGDIVKRFRIRFYSATELVAVVRDAGFRDVEVHGGLDRRAVTPQESLVLRGVK